MTLPDALLQNKCTNCSRGPQPRDQFIAKKGGAIVKQCLKCREKDDLKKKKPENRAKANARQNDRQYYKTSRAKKLEEDAEEFRRHNAEMQKARRDRKKDEAGS